MNQKGYFATIGTFDGVHRGHLLLLNMLKAEAKAAGLMPLAIVFATHPLSMIRPEQMPPQLSTFEQKKRLIEQQGVEVFPLKPTEELRSLTSDQFMAKIRDEIGVFGLIFGHDNSIGSNRGATFDTYVEQGRRLGIKIVKGKQLPGVSSTLIRQALAGGKAAEAAEMLGRPYEICGHVTHGKELGRTIGFPTINLKPDSSYILIPARGVYATTVLLPGDAKPRPAVTNIGLRPTVDSSRSLSIETYIPGFHGNLYDAPVSLGFIDKIRDEIRFDSLDSLKNQIEKDVTSSLEIITNTSYGNN